jgi:hypothetical protein
LEEVGCVIEFSERFLHQIPDRDRHAATREEITVRLNGDETVASRALIGPATRQELQGSVHRNFRRVEKPKTFGPGASPAHDLNELTCFSRSQDLLAQRRATSTGNESVGPHPRYSEFSTQPSHPRKLAKVAAMGGKRNHGADTRSHQAFDRFDRPPEVSPTANCVVSGFGSFDADLNETRSEAMEAICHGRIDEAAIRQDGETEIIFVGRKYVEQLQKVLSRKRFTACDGDVAANGLFRTAAPGSQQIQVLL